jgi:hypothetical protein
MMSVFGGSRKSALFEDEVDEGPEKALALTLESLNTVIN